MRVPHVPGRPPGFAPLSALLALGLAAAVVAAPGTSGPVARDEPATAATPARVHPALELVGHFSRWKKKPSVFQNGYWWAVVKDTKSGAVFQKGLYHTEAEADSAASDWAADMNHRFVDNPGCPPVPATC